MGKYSNLSIENLVGAFGDSYEGGQASTYASKLANIYSIEGETVGLVSTGSSQGLRARSGGRHVTAPVEYKNLITNIVYEDAVEFPAESFRWDKVGALEQTVREMAQYAAFHWNELVTSLITSNGLTVDGQNFFDTDHEVQNSGVQKNVLTASEIGALNVGTAAAPTTAEMAVIIPKIVAWMHTYKNEGGKAINGTARKFAIMTSNTDVWAAALGATSQVNLASNETNPVMNLKAQGYEFEVILEVGLGASTSVDFYVFRTDGVVKPFALIDEQPIETQVLDEDSEHCIETGNVFFGVKTVRGAGTQRWQHGVKATLS